MPKKTERGAEATSHAHISMSRPKTQEERILDYIRAKGSITSMDAFTDLKITRLSGRIFDLRKAGYDIEMEWETNQYGERYGRYTLHEEEIA